MRSLTSVLQEHEREYVVANKGTIRGQDGTDSDPVDSCPENEK